MRQYQLKKLTGIIVKWRNKSIGNDFIDSTLPWGGTMLVWIEETTDAMIDPTGSAVCSGISADISSGWGVSCGWISREEGDDSTWIGEPGGGGGIAVLWRFACDLVLLGPFLFTWLDWGASAVVLVLMVFADLPVCWYNSKFFISTRVTEYWRNFGWNGRSYRWSSLSSRCVLKKLCEYNIELV